MLSPVFTFHQRDISTLTQLIVQPFISLQHATSKHRNKIIKLESLHFTRALVQRCSLMRLKIQREISIDGI